MLEHFIAGDGASPCTKIGANLKGVLFFPEDDVYFLQNIAHIRAARQLRDDVAANDFLMVDQEGDKFGVLNLQGTG